MSYIEQHNDKAILLLPIFAFLEACVGIGLLVSGVFLLALASLMYLNGWASLSTIYVLALLGAVCGDHVGFYVGRAVGPRLHHLRLAQKYQNNLSKAEQMVRRFGAYAIFVGRFIPAIRSLIPAMLGISEFNRLRYSVLDLMACLLWAAALIVLVQGADQLFS